MIWQYEWCTTQIKRERERERVNGSNANNKMCFEVRAPSSTSPPSPRRISNPLTCPPRTPTQGTSTEDVGANTTGSTELLSQPIQPPLRQYKGSTEGRSTELHQSNQYNLHRGNTNTTSHKRGRPLAKQTQPQPLPKRELTTTQIHLYQRGISQIRMVTTRWSQRPQTKFSHK